MKSIIHIDYSSSVKLRQVSGLRYDAILEIGDGCDLYLSRKHLESIQTEIRTILEKKI